MVFSPPASLSGIGLIVWMASQRHRFLLSDDPFYGTSSVDGTRTQQ
jgi:hypothetical protein